QYDVVDKLAISIFFKDNKQFEMIFLNSETKTDSFTYKTLQESFNLLANKLESIISINNANVTDSKKVSDADEISKFKALLDEGTITKGEFDAKKKQILGL
ncbi:SHOCT domain-containing protein, partial [Oenococcus oeni]